MHQNSGPEDRRRRRGDPVAPAVRARGGPCRPALPGDTTVPAGTAVALLLGLVAMTGSVVALGAALVVVLVAWLLGADDVDQVDQLDRVDGGRPAPGPWPPPGPRPPFGGPFGWF